MTNISVLEQSAGTPICHSPRWGLSHPTRPKCKLAIPLRNHSEPPLAVGRNSNQQSVCSLRAVIVARHPAAAGCLATIIQSLRDKDTYSFTPWGKSLSGLHRSSVIRRSSRRTRSPRSSRKGARRFVGVLARRELQSHWSHRSHESHLFAAPDGVPELNVADTPSALLTPEF